MGFEVATDLEKQMADMINQERREAGLSDLKISMNMNESAQDHSEWMGENGILSHTGEGGSSARERIEESGLPLEGRWVTLENVAYVSHRDGMSIDEVRQMHENLMNSPGHRANILNDEVEFVGIGLSTGTVTQGSITYPVVFVTQNFATTDGPVVAQEEVDGEDMAVTYQEGEQVGEAVPINETPVEPGPVTPTDPGNPEDPDDEEEDPQDEDSGKGGGCFVATAAYGTRNHPDVVDLRAFRDEVLVRSAAGRAFVRTYWVVGPKLARVIRSDGASGTAMRRALVPVASMARKALRAN